MESIETGFCSFAIKKYSVDYRCPYFERREYTVKHLYVAREQKARLSRSVRARRINACWTLPLLDGGDTLYYKGIVLFEADWADRSSRVGTECVISGVWFL